MAFLAKKGSERREGRGRRVELGEPRDTRRAEVTAFHYFHFSIGLISWRALTGTAKADGVISPSISYLMFQAAWWSFIPCRGVASFLFTLEFSKIGHSALTA